ncbi:MAG: hypothetical protein WCY44_10330 [Sphaerochaetaceae bacterium]
MTRKKQIPLQLPGKSFVPACAKQSDQIRDDVVVNDEYGPVRMIRLQCSRLRVSHTADRDSR